MNKKQISVSPSKSPIGATIPRYIVRVLGEDVNLSERIYEIAIEYAKKVRKEHGDPIPDIRVTKRYNLSRKTEQMQKIVDELGAYSIDDINWSRLFSDAMLVALVDGRLKPNQQASTKNLV